MFGLGISGDDRAEYYFGGGIRLNDEVTFSLAVEWSLVRRKWRQKPGRDGGGSSAFPTR